MAVGTCDPASRGDEYNSQVLERGPVLIDVHFGWDGVSVRPNCDGPVSYIRVRNTGTVTWYATLPNKKRGQKYIAIPPGTDETTTDTAALASLGLSNFSDVAGVGLHPTPDAPGFVKL